MRTNKELLTAKFRCVNFYSLSDYARYIIHSHNGIQLRNMSHIRMYINTYKEKVLHIGLIDNSIYNINDLVTIEAKITQFGFVDGIITNINYPNIDNWLKDNSEVSYLSIESTKRLGIVTSFSDIPKLQLRVK